MSREDNIECAKALATRLGTDIPDDIQANLWCLPLLLELTKRIETLEAEVVELKSKRITETFVRNRNRPRSFA